MEPTRVSSALDVRTTLAPPNIRIWWSTLRRTCMVTGAIWPLLASAALLLASISPWLSTPLIHTYRAWDIPIALGWGTPISFFSYGLLCLVLAVVFAFYTLRLLFRHMSASEANMRPSYQRLRVPLLMALASIAVTAMLVFQFVFVDFQFVSILVDQENQGSLIRPFLGYFLPFPIVPTAAFQVPIATPSDRFGFLVRLVMSSAINLGALLPLIAAILCLLGALHRWRANQALTAAQRREARHVGARFWILTAAVGVFALLLFGRAPLGLLFEMEANGARVAGNYASALQQYARAKRFTPSLNDLASFHQERGEALFLEGRQSNLDVGLYLAESYRDLGAYQQAWDEDQNLAAVYPNNPLVLSDTVLSLEHLAYNNSNPGLTPFDNESLVRDPTIAGQVSVSDAALPWLNSLIQISPQNAFAHYLRGRILFSQAAYGRAENDLWIVLGLTTDDEMKSTAYTYLSFCSIGTGDYISGRDYLIDAENLDGSYYNSTAREAASGLH